MPILGTWEQTSIAKAYKDLFPISHFRRIHDEHLLPAGRIRISIVPHLHSHFNTGIMTVNFFTPLHIDQADSMLKTQYHRGKVVQMTFNGLALYSNKAQKGISHRHGDYQFFFGFHTYRGYFIGHFALRKQGATTSDNVSFFNNF